MSVILETTIGDVTIDLYCTERPTCSKNFLKLCKVKFYNFCLFHAVQKNSVAQTGDPTGTGRGGESIFARLYGDQASAFDAERKPRIKHRTLGQVSMVNDGAGKHTSQFLITLGTELDYLDEQQHTVFGEVVEGFDTLEKLNQIYCDKEHRPFQDVRISHTVVLDDPFPDPDNLEIPDRSPDPDRTVLQSDRIGAHEKLDDTEGLTAEEVEERVAKKEAASNEQLLRIVADIPDIEGITPNDRSLFVCKLNPVTSSEDLEIIFSRFGEIKECSVVTDQKTGNSLQYAFIEFERREDCENAYFKMENVLIDDRRIHVDFSQSLHREMIEFKKGSRRQKETAPPRRGPAAKQFDFVFEEEEEEENSRKKEKKRKKERSRSRERDENERKKERREKSPEEERRLDRERRDDNRDSRDKRDDNRDSRDRRDDNRDSRDRRDNYRDSRDGRNDNRDSRDRRDNYRDSRGGRNDNRDSRGGRSDNRDSRGGRSDNRDRRGGYRDKREIRDDYRDSRDSRDRRDDRREDYRERRDRKNDYHDRKDSKREKVVRRSRSRDRRERS